MPLRVCALMLALWGALAVAMPSPCIYELATESSPLFDGTAFDSENPNHRLAAPLLAIRQLYVDGFLKDDGTPFHVRWDGRHIVVRAVLDSETKGFSPIGEHCPDLTYHLRSEEDGSYLSFHAYHPMVIALTGTLAVYSDLYLHQVTAAEIHQVFGNK